MVKAKDRGTMTSLEKALGEILETKVPGDAAPDLVYPIIPMISMKRIVEGAVSIAEHGPLKTTVGHMTRGRIYVEYLKKLEALDAQKVEAP
jgi:hypothetical protein